MFKQQRQNYEGVYGDAIAIVESGDTGDRRTAEHQKDCVKQEFDKLDEFGQALLSLVPHVTSGVEPEDKELFDCSKVRLSFRQILTSTKLDKVAKEVEAHDKK